jgi:Tol biopolymer transport system component
MMHRLAAFAAVLALAVLGVAACADGGSSASVAADAKVSVAGGSSGGSPSARLKAFSGHGRLAFVSDDRLYVLDGSAAGKPATLHTVVTGKVPGSHGSAAGEPSTLHTVVTGKVPGSPAWSPDGRWLAFLVGAPSADGAVTSGALWLAGPDGQGAHQVLPKSGGFAWSPKADELAAVSGYGGKLFAVQPGRPPYPVLEAPGLTEASPAWSPDGRELAVAVVNVTAKKRLVSSAIDVFPATGGIAATTIAFSRADALIVDGWWANGQGLFAWSDPRDSASLAVNGLPLVSYTLDGKTATQLASTLVHTEFAVPGGNGVTLVTGGDRYLWKAKTIEDCAVSGKCGPGMDATPAPVNLDPAGAWDKGEPTLAFVHAAQETAAGFSQQELKAWYRTRELWVWVGTGANPHPVTRAGAGVAAPTWSANSQDILYVRDNALWLIPIFASSGYPSSAPALPVVSQLFAGNWPNVDGYTAWQSQFAWRT